MGLGRGLALCRGLALVWTEGDPDFVAWAPLIPHAPPLIPHAYAPRQAFQLPALHASHDPLGAGLIDLRELFFTMGTNQDGIISVEEHTANEFKTPQLQLARVERPHPIERTHLIPRGPVCAVPWACPQHPRT